MKKRGAPSTTFKGCGVTVTAAVAMLSSPAALPTISAQPAALSGTLVITNKSPSTATIIDVASNKILATLPTGNGPHEVVLSANGSTAVVTDYGGPGARNTLTVIDVPALRVLRTIDLGKYRAPHGIVLLPGDSLAAVTSEATRNVVIVNVLRGTVKMAIGTESNGSHMIGVTADGSTGFTGNIGSNTVTELDMKSGKVVRSYPVPPQPEAINVTSDGTEVWVGSNATGKVSVLNPATGAVTTAAEGVSWPYRVLFTPDGGTVVIPDMNNNEIRFLDRATSRELARVALPDAGPQGVAMSPDGKFLFVSLSKQARVAIIDVRARAVVGYVASGETPDGIAYTTRVMER